MKTVIELAREANAFSYVKDADSTPHLWAFSPTELERFSELVRADAIARMAEQPAQQEPVAFYRCNGCGHAYEQVHPTSCDCMEGSSFEQVNYYTTPQPAQRKPLTYEEFEVLHHKAKGYVHTGLMDVVRIVEHHHGIKENT